MLKEFPMLLLLATCLLAVTQYLEPKRIRASLGSQFKKTQPSMVGKPWWRGAGGSWSHCIYIWEAKRYMFVSVHFFLFIQSRVIPIPEMVPLLSMVDLPTSVNPI